MFQKDLNSQEENRTKDKTSLSSIVATTLTPKYLSKPEVTVLQQQDLKWHYSTEHAGQHAGNEGEERELFNLREHVVKINCKSDSLRLLPPRTQTRQQTRQHRYDVILPRTTSWESNRCKYPPHTPHVSALTCPSLLFCTARQTAMQRYSLQL